MTELHPTLVARTMHRDALSQRGGSGLAMATMLRRGRAVWGNPFGCVLLLRWRGAKLPVGRIDPGAPRVAVLVGVGRSGTVREWTGVAHPAEGAEVETVWHYAVQPVSGGGMLNDYDPGTIQAAVVNVSTLPEVSVGLLPNAPAALDVRLLPGLLPCVSWTYSTFGQQSSPADFAVYATSGAAFDWASPIGTVSYIPGRSRYEWTGEALATGDVRHYSVRARTAGGVLSLIPRIGLDPGGLYRDVELARCPRLVVPTPTPPTPAGMVAEVA